LMIPLHAAAVPMLPEATSRRFEIIKISFPPSFDVLMFAVVGTYVSFGRAAQEPTQPICFASCAGFPHRVRDTSSNR